MRSALVWEITQRIVINSLPTFRDNLSVPSSRVSILILEDRTDRLSRNLRYGITTIRCVTTQKNADLIYFPAEAWNHAEIPIFWLLLSYFISSRVGPVDDPTEIRVAFVDRDTALSSMAFWRKYLNMCNWAEDVEISSNSLKNFNPS